MPRRRNNTVPRNMKEKQIITTRLIEISLKVDDYVYKQIPISKADAEQYMREVVSYKTKCHHDERSLQVIEKLTRCMKAIIVELQELKGNTCDNPFPGHDYREVSLSPVYSITDEDRTQFTQIDEGRPNFITEADTEDIEIINLCDVDDDQRQARENTNCDKRYGSYFPGHDNREVSISPVDKCGNQCKQINEDKTNLFSNENTKDIEIVDHWTTNGNSFSSPIINVEVDIHRAISNITLTDSLDLTSTNDILSQSILINVEGIDKLQENINITSTRAIDSSYNKVKTVNSANTHVTTRRVINKTENNLEKKIPSSVIKPNVTANAPVETVTGAKINQNNESNAGVQNTGIVNIIEHNASKGTNLHVFNRNQSKEFDKIGFHTNQITHPDEPTLCLTDKRSSVNNSNCVPIAQSTQVVKVLSSNSKTVKKTFDRNVFDILSNTTSEANKRHTIDFNNAATENSVATKKKRRPRKKLPKLVKEIESKTKRSRKKTNDSSTVLSNKKTNVPIYNSNIENDLSWIENIRYVREVRPEENDLHMNLEESFWENYDLPASWNESEFV